MIPYLILAAAIVAAGILAGVALARHAGQSDTWGMVTSEDDGHAN